MEKLPPAVVLASLPCLLFLTVFCKKIQLDLS